MTTASNFKTDRSFFTVIVDHRKGAYVPEADLANLTEEKLIQQVRDGDLDDVLMIIEANPAEGWSRDVTEDIKYHAGKFCDVTRTDPNREHRIGCFEAGVGRFGPYSGRAA